jgi:hypothetical protein
MTDEVKQEQEAQPARTFTLERKKRVAIVGCADSKTLAPWNNAKEWEFWGVNNLHLTIPKAPWTRWFELHSFTYNEATGKYARRGKEDFRGQPVGQYLASLQALNIPVYMQRPWPIITNAVQYPVQQILQSFGRYFTNTISWEIALAILEGFETIGIWGVDMAVSSPLRSQNEYSHQRPSCEYFIGLARGRGIEVVIPDQCDLLKSRFLYCFEEIQETAFNKKLEDMERSMQQRQADAEQKMKSNEAKIHQYIGARSALQEVKKIWGND